MEVRVSTIVCLRTRFGCLGFLLFKCKSTHASITSRDNTHYFKAESSGVGTQTFEELEVPGGHLSSEHYKL